MYCGTFIHSPSLSADWWATMPDIVILSASLTSTLTRSMSAFALAPCLLAMVADLDERGHGVVELLSSGVPSQRERRTLSREESVGTGDDRASVVIDDGSSRAHEHIRVHLVTLLLKLLV